MSQLPSVLNMSDYSHYCAIVVIMKKSSLRRRMVKTGDGRLVPGQTMMMRGLGSGQKGTSMALCDCSWLSLPHWCLCPGTTMHCQAVLGVLCDWSWLSLSHWCLCPGTTMHCQAVLGVLCDCSWLFLPHMCLVSRHHYALPGGVGGAV